MRKIACLAFVIASATAGAFAQGSVEIVDLGETIVTGALLAPSALSPTAATVVVSAEEITASGAVTVADVLADVPGLEIKAYGYSGSLKTVSVRGAAGGHVLVVLDGVRLNDPRTGSVDLSSIPVAGIERVEVLRSGASALYGSDAIAGVVYITTAKTGDPRLSVTASTTAYPLAAAEGSDALLASQALSVAGRATLGSVTINASGGFERAADTVPVADEATAYAMRDNAGFLGAYAGLGAVSPLFGGVVTASAFGRYADKGVPGSIGYIMLNAAQTEYDGRGALAWGIDTLADGAASVTAGVSGSWSRLHYVDPDSYLGSVDDTHDSLGGEASLRAEFLAGPAVVRTGLSGGLAAASSTAIGEKSRIYAGAYAVPELAFGDFTLAPSVRYDMFSDFAAGLSYGLGASWRSGGLSITANGASAYKAPSFNDLYWPETAGEKGNPDLDPERSWSAEVGAEYNSELFSIRANPYLRYVDDMIAWSSADGLFWTTDNIGTALYIGADVAATVDIGAMFGKLSYSYTLAKNISGNTAFADAKRLASVPLHTVKAEIGARVGIVKASVNSSIRLDRIDSKGDALGDVFLLGLSAECEALRGAFVGLSCANLLNEVYTENSGYPMAGFSMTASLRFER